MNNYINIVKNSIINLYKRGAVAIIIGNFTTSFLTFFGSIVIVRVMTKTDFGVLSYIENLYGFIYIFMGMGLKNAILRYIVLGDTIEEKSKRYNYLIKMGSLFNIALVGISLIFNLFYEHPSQYDDICFLMGIYIILLIPQYISECNITNYRAFFDNNQFAISSIVLSVGIILSKIIGYKIFDLFGIIILMIITYCLVSIITTIDNKYRYFRHENGCIKNKKLIKEINIYSLQYMLTNGVWGLFMLVDVYLIGYLTNDLTLVADYKVAHVFPGAMTILSSTIGIFVTPYFVKNEKNKLWIKNKYKLLFIITAAFIGITIIFLMLISKYLIIHIYGEQYLNITPVMIMLFIGAFFNAGIRYTSANVLAALGLVSYNLKVSICGIIFEIIIDIVLIPRFGLYGVAFSNIIVYVYMAVALTIFFYKHYFIHSSDEG